MAMRKPSLIDKLSFGPDGEVNGLVKFKAKDGSQAELEFTDGKVTYSSDPSNTGLAAEAVKFLSENGKKRNERFVLDSFGTACLVAESTRTPEGVLEKTGHFKDRIFKNLGITPDGTFTHADKLKDGRSYEVVRGVVRVEDAVSGALRVPTNLEIDDVMELMTRQKVVDVLTRKKQGGVLYRDSGSGEIKVAESNDLYNRAKKRIQELYEESPRRSDDDIRSVVKAEMDEFYTMDPSTMKSIERAALAAVQSGEKMDRRIAGAKAMPAILASGGVAGVASVGKGAMRKIGIGSEAKVDKLEKRHNLISEMRKMEDAGKNEAQIKTELGKEHATDLVDAVWERAHDPKIKESRAKKIAVEQGYDQLVVDMRKEKKSEKAIREKLMEKMEEHDLSPEEKKEIISASADQADSLWHRAGMLVKKFPVKKALAVAGAAALVPVAALGAAGIGGYRALGYGARTVKAEWQGLKQTVPPLVGTILKPLKRLATPFQRIAQGVSWGAKKAINPKRKEAKKWYTKPFAALYNAGATLTHRAQQLALITGGALALGAVGTIEAPVRAVAEDIVGVHYEKGGLTMHGGVFDLANNTVALGEGLLSAPIEAWNAQDLSQVNLVVSRAASNEQAQGHGDAHGHDEAHGHGDAHGHDEAHGHGDAHGHDEAHGHGDAHGHDEAHGHGDAHGHEDAHGHADAHGHGAAHHLNLTPVEKHRVFSAFQKWRKAKAGEDADERLGELINAGVDALDVEEKVPGFLKWPLAFAGEAAVGLKNWAFPHKNIHGIDIHYDHIGSQIRKMDKEGRNSFYKSLDMEQVVDECRLIARKERLEQALKSEEGHHKVEHQIEALFGKAGPYDSEDLKKYSKTLLDKLGEAKDVDESVREKCEKMRKFIRDIRDLLLSDDGHGHTWLHDVYEHEKEKVLTIDYDTFGNYIFENVKDDKTIKAFKKAYKARVFENKFRFLLDEPRFDAALGKESMREEAKKQVYALFDLSNGVDAGDIVRQVEELKKTLKLNTTPPPTAGTFEGDLLANLDKAVATLTRPGKLEKLFGDEAKELTIDYDTFGNYVFENIKGTKQIAEFFKGYKPRVFENKFRLLLDKDRLEKALQNDGTREEVQKQIYALFDLSNGVDGKDIDRQTAELKKTLGLNVSPPPLPGSSEAHVLENIDQAVALLKTGDNLKKIFEGVEKELTIDYDTFGNFVFENIKEDKHRAAFKKSYRARVFENKFRFLLDDARFDKAAKGDSREDLKKQIYALFDLSNGVDAEDIKRQADELKKVLKLITTPPSTAGTFEGDLLANLDKAVATLTRPGKLEALFAGEPKKITIDYENFGDGILENVTDTESADAFYRSFKPDVFQTKFEILLNKKELEKSMKKKESKDEVKRKIRELLNMSGSMGLDALARRRDKLISVLSVAKIATSGGKTKHQELEDITAMMLENLGWDVGAKTAKTGPDNLWNTLYAEKPETATPRYAEFGQFMDGLAPEEVPAALRGYSRAAFRKQFRPLWDKSSLDKEVKREDTRKMAAARLLTLIGYPAGSGLSYTEMEKIIRGYQAMLTLERGSTDTEVKKGADEMWQDLEEVMNAIPGETELSAVMTEKKETAYSNFNNFMVSLSDDQFRKLTLGDFAIQYGRLASNSPIAKGSLEQNEAQAQWKSFFGTDKKLDENTVRTIVEDMKSSIATYTAVSSHPFNAKAKKLEGLLNNIVGALQQAYIDSIFA